MTQTMMGIHQWKTSADGTEGINISSEASVASTKRFLQTNLIQFKQKRRPRRTAPMMYCSKRLFVA